MVTLKQLAGWLPRDPFDRTFVVVLVVALTVIVLGYPYVSAEVPIHFNRDLRADLFVSKPLGPFVLPAVAVVIYGAAHAVIAPVRLLGSAALGALEAAVKAIQLGLALLLIAANLYLSFGPVLFGVTFK